MDDVGLSESLLETMIHKISANECQIDIMLNLGLNMSAIVEDGGTQLAKVSFLPNNAATNATVWLKALN